MTSLVYGYGGMLPPEELIEREHRLIVPNFVRGYDLLNLII